MGMSVTSLRGIGPSITFSPGVGPADKGSVWCGRVHHAHTRRGVVCFGPTQYGTTLCMRHGFFTMHAACSMLCMMTVAVAVVACVEATGDGECCQ